MKSKEEIEGLGNLYLINETRKWVGDDIPDVYTQDDIIKAVAWGYDEGFYDATKWHYPSKGELPEKDVKCLVHTIADNYYVALIDSSDKCWCTGEMFEKILRPGDIDRWQYIELPKEEK